MPRFLLHQSASNGALWKQARTRMVRAARLAAVSSPDGRRSSEPCFRRASRGMEEAEGRWPSLALGDGSRPGGVDDRCRLGLAVSDCLDISWTFCCRP
jgi:hypothetical protein